MTHKYLAPDIIHASTSIGVVKWARPVGYAQFSRIFLWGGPRFKARPLYYLYARPSHFLQGRALTSFLCVQLLAFKTARPSCPPPFYCGVDQGCRLTPSTMPDQSYF